MSARAKRERYRRELREQILEAAREAVVRGGGEGLSMRRLAESIGYSPGTIYLHFKDKQELIDCVVEETFARLLAVLEAIDESERGVASLRKKLRAYVDFGLSHPHHYHCAFMMRPARDSRSERAVPHPAFDVLRSSVRDCLQRGQIQPRDVETTSQALWATIHGITSLLIVRSDFPWTDRESLIDQVIDTAIAGLRTPRGRN